MRSVYVLQHNVTREIYIGKTNNFARRLSEHNHGEQTSTKRKSVEWVPVYIEIYRSKQDASTRELRLKHHGRAKQELLKRIALSLLS